MLQLPTFEEGFDEIYEVASSAAGETVTRLRL
jgi:hypothetical protein